MGGLCKIQKIGLAFMMEIGLTYAHFALFDDFFNNNDREFPP
jgi:hypothetical protein